MIIAVNNKSRAGVYNSEEHENIQRIDRSPLQLLSESSIIAAVNTPEMFDIALDSPSRILYILTGNPLDLPLMLARAKRCEKICLVNLDFIDGLARDRHAVQFLAAHKVDGIVSTRSDVLKSAQQLHLITIQRTFAIDAAAITTALKSLSQFLPDAIEILPAVAAPKVARRLHAAYPKLNLIGGGLIETVKEIEDLFHSGIHSVSVSNPRLWLA
jgi:glycerol uptake operon antiterminator